MSAGPASPPVWLAAAPTPAGEVIAQATAHWKGVIPSAAITPPTSAAPVSSSVRTATRRYSSGSIACPSIRVITPCLAALIAAFIADDIFPDGLGTTVTRSSAAASSWAICSVRSREGPTASTSSNPPG